jgi:hypothetical protein
LLASLLASLQLGSVARDDRATTPDARSGVLVGAHQVATTLVSVADSHSQDQHPAIAALLL